MLVLLHSTRSTQRTTRRQRTLAVRWLHALKPAWMHELLHTIPSTVPSIRQARSSRLIRLVVSELFRK